jgi:ubiquinone biosynthesis protein UbiJ
MLIPRLRKKIIVQVLMRSPSTYTHIESMLFKAAEVEHFEDKIDRLDDAAGRLFRQLMEED